MFLLPRKQPVLLVASTQTATLCQSLVGVAERRCVDVQCRRAPRTHVLFLHMCTCVCVCARARAQALLRRISHYIYVHRRAPRTHVQEKEAFNTNVQHERTRAATLTRRLQLNSSHRTGKPRPSTGQNTGSNSLLDKELFVYGPPYIPTLHLSASAKPPPSRCRGVAAVTAEHDMPRLLHCNLHVPLRLFLFLRERAPWVTGA